MRSRVDRWGKPRARESGAMVAAVRWSTRSPSRAGASLCALLCVAWVAWAMLSGVIAMLGAGDAHSSGPLSLRGEASSSHLSTRDLGARAAAPDVRAREDAIAAFLARELPEASGGADSAAVVRARVPDSGVAPGSVESGPLWAAAGTPRWPPPATADEASLAQPLSGADDATVGHPPGTTLPAECGSLAALAQSFMRSGTVGNDEGGADGDTGRSGAGGDGDAGAGDDEDAVESDDADAGDGPQAAPAADRTARLHWFAFTRRASDWDAGMHARALESVFAANRRATAVVMVTPALRAGGDAAAAAFCSSLSQRYTARGYDLRLAAVSPSDPALAAIAAGPHTRRWLTSTSLLPAVAAHWAFADHMSDLLALLGVHMYGGTAMDFTTVLTRPLPPTVTASGNAGHVNVAPRGATGVDAAAAAGRLGGAAAPTHWLPESPPLGKEACWPSGAFVRAAGSRFEPGHPFVTAALERAASTYLFDTFGATPCSGGGVAGEGLVRLPSPLPLPVTAADGPVQRAGEEGGGINGEDARVAAALEAAAGAWAADAGVQGTVGDGGDVHHFGLTALSRACGVAGGIAGDGFSGSIADITFVPTHAEGAMADWFGAQPHARMHMRQLARLNYAAHSPRQPAHRRFSADAAGQGAGAGAAGAVLVSEPGSTSAEVFALTELGITQAGAVPTLVAPRVFVSTPHKGGALRGVDAVRVTGDVCKMVVDPATGEGTDGSTTICGTGADGREDLSRLDPALQVTVTVSAGSGAVVVVSDSAEDVAAGPDGQVPGANAAVTLVFRGGAALAEVNDVLSRVRYLDPPDAATVYDDVSVKVDATFRVPRPGSAVPIKVRRVIEASIRVAVFGRALTLGTKTLGRWDHVKRLVGGFRQLYPGAPVVVSDDSGVVPVDTAAGQARAVATAAQVAQYTGATDAGVNGGGPVTLLGLPDDAGLSTGRNALLDAATTDFVLYLDDDFLVRADTLSDDLLAVLVAENADIAAGKIPEDEARYGSDFSGVMSIRPDESGHGNKLQFSPGYKAQRDGCLEVDVVPNCYVLRRDKVAGVRWDDALKMGEHEDFFIRAKQAGLTVLTCPKVAMHHNFAATVRPPPGAEADKYGKQRLRADEFMRMMMAKHALVRYVSFDGWVAQDMAGDTKGTYDPRPEAVTPATYEKSQQA